MTEVSVWPIFTAITEPPPTSTVFTMVMAVLRLPSTRQLRLSSTPATFTAPAIWQALALMLVPVVSLNTTAPQLNALAQGELLSSIKA